MIIKAYKIKGKSQVVYEREDGSREIFIGGTPAWRNNNPGNIKAMGDFAKRHGSIGTADSFAIFPSYELGRQAIFALLKTKKYQAMTIWEAMKPYAPKEDGNDPDRYRALVRKFTGIDLSRKLSTLNDKELESLVNAIERVEGSKPGRIIEQEAPKNNSLTISAVRKNKKGTITAYYIETFGWLKKGEAIALASQGKIDAVVATSRSGNLYLRTRPSPSIENLEDMG